MDLIKIGKFIANCRKEKNITQEQLAEKLYITDRAVSKWERGLSLPDADKMLDLCNIFDINVNELLNGEKIDMKDYKRKNEELLLELARQDELKNKKLMTCMWVITITTILFYIGIVLLSSILLDEGLLLGTIIVVSTIICVGVCFYGLKLEVDAGYYECRKCHHKHVPSYLTVLLAPHMSTTRYLKCPNCCKRSWCKKVMSKGEN
ncbi:MAG: helix-turn-helix transcriptional regulator [Bacilli bacterium]|nr:helix-turn-helix transcriptional regulator [Bacilli bacterium]